MALLIISFWQTDSIRLAVQLHQVSQANKSLQADICWESWIIIKWINADWNMGLFSDVEHHFIIRKLKRSNVPSAHSFQLGWDIAFTYYLLQVTTNKIPSHTHEFKSSVCTAIHHYLWWWTRTMLTITYLNLVLSVKNHAGWISCISNTIIIIIDNKTENDGRPDGLAFYLLTMPYVLYSFKIGVSKLKRNK